MKLKIIRFKTIGIKHLLDSLWFPRLVSHKFQSLVPFKGFWDLIYWQTHRPLTNEQTDWLIYWPSDLLTSLELPQLLYFTCLFHWLEQLDLTNNPMSILFNLAENDDFSKQFTVLKLKRDLLLDSKSWHSIQDIHTKKNNKNILRGPHNKS